MNDYNNKEFVYLGWACRVYQVNDNWYYQVLKSNGEWMQQGNAFSVQQAILSAFSAVENLGEYKE